MEANFTFTSLSEVKQSGTIGVRVVEERVFHTDCLNTADISRSFYTPVPGNSNVTLMNRVRRTGVDSGFSNAWNGRNDSFWHRLAAA